MDKDFLHLIENLADLIPQPASKLEDETLICECFCVSAADIRELCKTKMDLDLVQRELNLGKGCQSCLKNKDCWINNIF